LNRLNILFSNSPPGNEAEKLYKGLIGRQKQLILFLENPKVPATNNGSERALRNRVVHRKVCGCFRTPDGAKSHDVIASIIETAKKQGKNIMDSLKFPSFRFSHHLSNYCSFIILRIVNFIKISNNYLKLIYFILLGELNIKEILRKDKK
jgi:hypothetical protein